MGIEVGIRVGIEIQKVVGLGLFGRDVVLVDWVGALRTEMVALVLTPTDQKQREVNQIMFTQTGQGSVYIWFKNHQFELSNTF